jgi:hypothetical protein
MISVQRFEKHDDRVVAVDVDCVVDAFLAHHEVRSETP